MAKETHNDERLRILQEELESQLREELLSDPSEERFGSAYDELHRFFLDKVRREEIYAGEIRWFSKIFFKRIGSGKKVLDVGTGNGKLAIALAQNSNRVVGIDVSSIALETAKRKLNRVSNNDALAVTFQYGDARRLEFPDHSFDFVVSHDLIEHLPESDFLLHLDEVERVLRVGGRYLFWTPSRLRGGSSLGLHLKEYTVREMDAILKKRKFKYSWIDLRFFKVHWVLEWPQEILGIIIWYEKIVEQLVKYIPLPFKKFLVPPLFFCLTKIQQK